MYRFVCLVLFLLVGASLPALAMTMSDTDRLKIKLEYKIADRLTQQLGQQFKPELVYGLDGFRRDGFRFTYPRSESFPLTSTGWGSMFYGAAVFGKTRFSTGLFDRANYMEVRFLFIPLSRAKIGH